MKHAGPALKISPKKRVLTEAQKAASREAQRKRRAKNPERVREVGRESERRRRMRKYGLTEQGFEDMWKAQNYRCAICKIETPSSGRNWHIDHNHTTGNVRAILCHHCNLLLGNAKDSILVLESAIQYLKEHSN